MLPIILSASILSCSDANILIKKVEKTENINDQVRKELIYELKNAAPENCFK